MRVISFQARKVQMLHWIAACLFVLTLMYSTRASASSSETEQSAKPQVKAGEAIFMKRCLVCHNKQPGDTAPFGPPNLYVAFKGPTAISTKEATNIITHGKATMPAWAGILSKSDINNVIAYLRAR